MISSPTKHKFTIEDVILMEEAGLFHPEHRIELLHGEIIDMSPIHPLHATCVTILNSFFTRGFSPDQYIVSIQNPVKLSTKSVLQPDIVIARHRKGLLGGEYIQPEDIILLIEVAYSSYEYDRKTKLEIYAEAGIREYWIVNISQKELEVYTTPVSNAYSESNVYKKELETSLGLHLDVARIFSN